MEQAGTCAVVVGAGVRQGIGGATAALAGRQGLPVYVTGRTADKVNRLAAEIRDEGGDARPVPMDSTRQADVDALFERVAGDGFVPELVVYNVGYNRPSRFLNTSPAFVEGHWRRCCLGGLLVGQAALRRMLPSETGKGSGTILYTGATASMRGRPLFGAFASAKASLRAMVQSMAAEFGPRGIHIAHAVIDGTVEGEVIKRFGKGLGWLVLRSKGLEGGLLPDEIARTFWQVHRQPAGAWTHEFDLRPFKEAF